MGVLVCYDEFSYDVVNDHQFEYLVQAGRIVGYDDTGSWVKRENDSHPVDQPKSNLSEVGAHRR